MSDPAVRVNFQISIIVFSPTVLNLPPSSTGHFTNYNKCTAHFTNLKPQQMYRPLQNYDT